jgi:hypothetical protein
MNSKFKIGDLVQVKQSNKLSLTLRFWYNKLGIITKIIKTESGSYHQYRVMFERNKYSIFNEFELELMARANKS